MEANKILSADILDLVFEGRNKEYGAYDLRKTYNKRIIMALIITGSLMILALLGSVLASTLKSKDDNNLNHRHHRHQSHQILLRLKWLNSRLRKS